MTIEIPRHSASRGYGPVSGLQLQKTTARRGMKGSVSLHGLCALQPSVMATGEGMSRSLSALSSFHLCFLCTASLNLVV